MDKAGYACAVGWSASCCVTAYVGNGPFTRPSAPGNLVEAHARIVYTGRTSVLVTVETMDARSRVYTPGAHCIIDFVAVYVSWSLQVVPEWHPSSNADHTRKASPSSGSNSVDICRRPCASMTIRMRAPRRAPRTESNWTSARKRVVVWVSPAGDGGRIPRISCAQLGCLWNVQSAEISFFLVHFAHGVHEGSRLA
ncbi:hotdog domain-containing protein [Cryobacterium sp. TMT1-66-1]|uniref:hotdog domain-containing protein n=1 Tax=Cryobacterium sp. TMT1-66-1 TaxID=1259242 RepID=UPI00106BF5B7|nr:hotdog domain-containing protein [Cryobacterium sp. TMT1-66-1]TFD08262.1 hypothetical protein E3T29_05580 [Cryobacterium sp. TMT1-66-1]